MATKNMTFGDSSNTINVTANGNVVGANIKSKGSKTVPIYFDANGIAQETDMAVATASEAKTFLGIS